MTKQGTNILIVSIGGSFGGVETYITSLLRFLKNASDVRVLTSQPELQRRCHEMGVRVIAVRASCKVFRFALAFLLVPWILWRERIDTLQLNGYLETIFVSWGRLFGCRVICTRHGEFDVESYKWYRQPHKYLPRRLCRFFSQFASYVVCVSHTVSRDVSAFIAPEQVIVIRNCVESIPPFQVPKGEGIPLRLLYVGRLEQYKGIHLLIDAMRSLKDVTLTVVGDGDYRKQLETMAEGLCVTFVGFQAELALFYNNADLFIMPSMGPEGLPLSPLEAMASSLPVLLSDLPVHAEISAQGTAGALFRSGDQKDLRAQISRLRDLHERQERALVSYRLVEQGFNPQGARRSYRALFGVDTNHV